LSDEVIHSNAAAGSWETGSRPTLLKARVTILELTPPWHSSHLRYLLGDLLGDLLGESLDLAPLDARVSTLMSDLAAAIP